MTFPRNLQNDQNTLRTLNLTKILLKITYLGNFRGFGVCLVILEVVGYLWSFSTFWVYLSHVKGLGVFSSFYMFEDILVIF